MKFYSQSGEDFLLYSLFGRQKDGFYIDIGAYDGVHASNSLIFEKLGWSGVCVEPRAEYFPRLCRARPGAVCVNAAIVAGHETDLTIAMREHLLPLPESAADKTPAAPAPHRGCDVNYGKPAVRVLTLNELMKHYAPDRRRIHFMSIAAEGSRADILEAFAFDRYLVQVVVLVHDDEPRHNIDTILRARGYKFARQIGRNLVFARRADDAAFLAYKKVECEIEEAPHAGGEETGLAAKRVRRITDKRFHVADNTLCQHPNQPLSNLIEFFPGSYKRKQGLATRFVHAVNFFPSPGAEQARVATAMRIAREDDARSLAVAGSASGEVLLVNVQSDQDPDQTPEGFVRARDLDRDVRNLATFRHPRPIPLLFDILDRLVGQAGPDDYVIYTNADIRVQPHFYRTLRELIAYGFDAITINRRTIGNQDAFPSCDSPLILAESGILHGGFDCFVFQRALYDRFVGNNACVGTARVMRGLLHNIVSHADQMLMLRNVALTYHHGNDVLWDSDRYADQDTYNLNECVRTLQQLCMEPARQARLMAFCDGYPEAPVFRRIAKNHDPD